MREEGREILEGTWVFKARSQDVGSRSGLRTGDLGWGQGGSIPLLCASSWDREFTATLHRAQ